MLRKIPHANPLVFVDFREAKPQHCHGIAELCWLCSTVNKYFIRISVRSSGPGGLPSLFVTWLLMWKKSELVLT